MNYKKIVLFGALCLASTINLASCGEPSIPDSEKAVQMILKDAPTVTSKYGEDLAIANDGVVKVRFADDTRKEFDVTLDMIDQSNFNKNSIYEQTLDIKYQTLSVPFTFTLSRELSSISVKNAPTVTSKAAYPFEIANDGILSCLFADGGTEEVTITKDMLDLESIDANSIEEQEIKVTFKDKTASFKATLVLDEEDNSGNKTTNRFEAEWADFDGNGFVGVEDCGSVKREDGSQEQCVKSLFHVEEGGHVAWTINSEKTASANFALSIAKQSNFAGEWDRFTRFVVNGVSIKTNIQHTGSASSSNPWWDFALRESETTIHLRKGVNKIEIFTNKMSGREWTTCGGCNLNFLQITTSSTLTWTPKTTH